MKATASLASRPRSRRLPLLLLLAALFVIFAAVPGMAQTQPAAMSPGSQVTTPMDVASFLATLSSPSTGDLNGVTPAPKLASGCTSNADCGPGQLCCLACGYAGCERRACFTTKVCPHFP